MTYALVIANAIESEHGRLPSGAKRLDDGAWITPYNREWTKAEHEACGFVVVVDTARPADTATDTYVRSVTLPGGVPTVTWTARAWTQAELAARAAEADRIVKAATLSPAAVTWLRQRAAAAAAATATTGNNVAMVNGILDDLAIFLDRFADLLEAHGFVR